MKSHCECLSVKRVDVGCSHLHTSTVCSKQTNRLHFFPHFISHFDSFEIREWMQKWSMGGSDREWAGCMKEGVVKHKNIYKKLEEKQKQTKFLHLIRYSGQPTNALILQRIETHTQNPTCTPLIWNNITFTQCSHTGTEISDTETVSRSHSACSRPVSAINPLFKEVPLVPHPLWDKTNNIKIIAETFLHLFDLYSHSFAFSSSEMQTLKHTHPHTHTHTF